MLKLHTIIIWLSKTFCTYLHRSEGIEMNSFHHVELLCLYEAVVVLGTYAHLQKQPSAKFSLSSVLESTFPGLHHFVTGLTKCDVLKNFLGLTYEQMQTKNLTSFNDISIDLITKEGSVKYNLTEAKHISVSLKDSEQIIVLIHGFMESSDGLMVQALAPELLKQETNNVLALDGRKVINLEYFRSSTYARFIGEKLGTFIAQMIEIGHDAKNITLIGHSLGAHIAGIAGKQVQLTTNQSVGRISALDPAGPCFSEVNALGRIDREDAEYVEAVHTNAGILGVKEPVGHKDFYPNGGMSQPGCFLSTCDHSRAWQLYAETINSPKQFPARKCDNWTMFREGLCANNEVSYMGLSSKPGLSGMYFLTTAPAAPFGLVKTGSG